MSLETGLVCTMMCDYGMKHGNIKITRLLNTGVLFDLNLYDLHHHTKCKLIGFHVHEKGNLEKGCETLGPHYNPTGALHGNLNDPRVHYGDLGNIIVNKDGTCKQKVVSTMLNIQELLGRSLVVHSKTDDLGKGGDAESLKTGNSGGRICCGVIGYF